MLRIKLSFVILITLFIGVALVGCEKEFSNNQTEENTLVLESKEVKMPNNKFTLTINSEGITSTDEAFLESFPQMTQAFITIGNQIIRTKSDEDMIITIENGIISSNNPNLDGKYMLDVLYEIGSFNYSNDRQINIVIDNSGFVSINSPVLFEMFPFAKDILIDFGNMLKDNINEGDTAIFSIKEDGEVYSEYFDIIIPKSTDGWEHYKDCVGDMWWAPIFAQIACLPAVWIY